MYPIHFNEMPNGYAALDNEPKFDPAIHLALEKPEMLYTLSDLGYTGETLENAPANFASTSVFRVLSPEGAETLYRTVKRLEEFTTSNPRIERNVRGGVYRSKFLRDLCLSPDFK